ncbi:phage tail protein [Planktotalea sp.]|uniref:phage tail-collar fiber domain-containing protein n=1 Tax=Planktotalea sp. TaxID=2029877 RepID=UPI003D6C08D1
MTQSSYSIVTTFGRAWNASAAAGVEVSPITHMVFGDGVSAPTGGETELVSEVHRQAINASGAIAEQGVAWFEAHLVANVGGFVIREMGLVTADGNLVAIGVIEDGIPKLDPSTGSTAELTMRMDVFFAKLDALVVEVAPLPHYLDRQRLLHPETMKLIATSDWQENTNADDPEKALEQVRLGKLLEASIIDNHPEAAATIFAGDVAHQGAPTVAQEASYSKPIMSIGGQRIRLDRLPGDLFAGPGNHDWVMRLLASDPVEGESMAEFLRHFPATRYHIEWGNIVIVVMGDEMMSKGGDLSYETFEWWRDIHLSKQADHFMLTVTHQSLQNTIDPSPNKPGRHIHNSQWFIDAMMDPDQPVKTNWINGHHGSYSTTDLDNRTALAHGGNRFIQIGAHLPSVAGDIPKRPVTYWTINFSAGSRNVLFKQWDVEAGGYIEAHDIIVQAPQPIRLNALPQFDGRHQKSLRFDPEADKAFAHAARQTLRFAKQELRLRKATGMPTAGMEKAL